jgi:hypothetical protein
MLSAQKLYLGDKEQCPETAIIRNIEATPSIWHISQHDRAQILGLSIACVTMCIAETRTKLDPVEFESLVQLTRYCSGMKPSPTDGVCVNTFGDYTTLPTLWCWNACYFNARPSSMSYVTNGPNSLVERRLICNFDGLPKVQN